MEVKPADSAYVVVGGGWAGCTVAARLSEDPAHSRSDVRSRWRELPRARILRQWCATPPLAPYVARRNYDPGASDAEIGACIRSSSESMFHPVGTARMGAVGDPMAVLDPRLRVRGINGLRVVDASAMPGIVRGHTMAPVLYIAERGCELIRREAD